MFLDKPQITFLTPNKTANDGSDVSFLCQGDAVPTSISYNWFKNGVRDSVNTGQQLTVRSVKKDSAGRYSCSGTNVVGTGEEKSTFLAVNCELYFNYIFLSSLSSVNLCSYPFDLNYM